MSTRLHIGNLSFDSDRDSLRAAFAADGRTVVDVQVVSDRVTGRPRGFGFVEMGSEADAQAAIQALDGALLDGRNLKVSEAQQRTSPRGGEGRARG
jgi:RNA recognition motif-containing protein